MVRSRVSFALAACLSFVLGACAPAVRVTPAQVARLASAQPDVLIAADVPVQLSTGYTRTIPAQSRWRAVGTLPQGTVYQPVDTVFAIEGRNVHEAYIVLQSGQLQGFYLPGESHYSPLSKPVSLPPERGVQR